MFVFRHDSGEECVFECRKSIPSVCLNGWDFLLIWIGFGDQTGL